MNDVIFTEKTEVEGGYCPIVGGKCRLDCRFFIDVEDGCMIEQSYRNTVEIFDRMNEAEKKAAETAEYTSRC